MILFIYIYLPVNEYQCWKWVSGGAASLSCGVLRCLAVYCLQELKKGSGNNSLGEDECFIGEGGIGGGNCLDL